jgi:flagellar motor protein MotB
MWTWLLGCPKNAVSDGTSLIEQLEREVIAGRERVKMLEAELEGCGEGTAPNTLYPELVQVFQGSDVEISREGIATRLVVKTSHLFGDPLALKARAEGDSTLDLLSVALRRYTDHQVMVIGHTSDRPLPPKWAGAYTSLVDWSSAIAGELVRRLVEDFGCNARQFTVGGRGAYSPRESNDLETGRDANQRLEIWIYPPSSAPPPAP